MLVGFLTPQPQRELHKVLKVNDQGRREDESDASSEGLDSTAASEDGRAHESRHARSWKGRETELPRAFGGTAALPAS